MRVCERAREGARGCERVREGASTHVPRLVGVRLVALVPPAVGPLWILAWKRQLGNVPDPAETYTPL